MGEAKLTDQRIRELLAAERELNALKSGGVDNWDGYDFAMEPIRAEADREEFLEGIIENICEILCTEIEEPAGGGCGYGFREAGTSALLNYLKTLSIIDASKDKVVAR